MFDQASRLKIRFETKKGLLSTEDLWDLPLTGAVSLDQIAIGLNRQLKESDTESFVLKGKASDELLKLKFEIVKHVISVRLAEAEKEEEIRVNREKRQRILAIIAEKEDESLKSTSLEELRKLANEL